jgi:methyltransferase
MSSASSEVPPSLALAAFLLFLVLERALELWMSARNSRRLFARGAREHGREHFPLLVALHTAFPLALVAEVLWLGARPGQLAAAWAALWAIAQVLRWTAMRSLGERWNTRVIVLPGAPLVTSGPYRWLRHPNYVAVAIELLAGPLAFGAWRTALLFSIANLLALRVRIRCEDRALGRTEPWRA